MWLKQLRIYKRISRQVLATAMGIATNTLDSYESGGWPILRAKLVGARAQVSAAGSISAALDHFRETPYFIDLRLAISMMELLEFSSIYSLLDALDTGDFLEVDAKDHESISV